MITKLPAAYCPTMIVTIDDDPIFLDSLQLRLGEAWRLMPFTSPQQAVKFLTQEYKPSKFLENCIEYNEDDAADQRGMNIDIKEIHRLVYDSNRFSQIGVIILDFSMPGMNGEEVARLLKHLPFQIILLTGEASHELATKLFNQGLIKSFARKDQENIDVTLKHMIAELQQNYFQQQSALIVDSLIKKSKQFEYMSLSCLDDTTFMGYFFTLVFEKKIVEYYLLDTSGSFLMLDANAKPSWLLTKDLGDMAALKDMLRFDRNIASDNIAAQIERNEVLLHIFDNPSNPEAHSNWQHNLYPATKISGNTDYFCCYVTEPKMPTGLDMKAIESYRQYLLKH